MNATHPPWVFQAWVVSDEISKMTKRCFNSVYYYFIGAHSERVQCTRNFVAWNDGTCSDINILYSALLWQYCQWCRCPQHASTIQWCVPYAMEKSTYQRHRHPSIALSKCTILWKKWTANQWLVCDVNFEKIHFMMLNFKLYSLWKTARPNIGFNSEEWRLACISGTLLYEAVPTAHNN